MNENNWSIGARFRSLLERSFSAGICYQLITFIALTPLVSILFRKFVPAGFTLTELRQVILRRENVDGSGNTFRFAN